MIAATCDCHRNGCDNDKHEQPPLRIHNSDQLRVMMLETAVTTIFYSSHQLTIDIFTSSHSTAMSSSLDVKLSKIHYSTVNDTA
jgi:hypothetical protein